MTQPGLELGPLDPEISAQSTRLLSLPSKLQTEDSTLQLLLTGLVQTDDRSALLEITRQLQLENTVGDKVFVSINCP